MKLSGKLSLALGIAFTCGAVSMAHAAGAGSAVVSNPGAADLSGVKAVWLAYPYVGPFAFNKLKPWRRCPKVLAVTCRRDHLTTVRNAEQVNAMIRNCGAEVESWIAEGTHAFDEPTNNGPMRHHPVLTEEALARFRAFLEDAVPHA